jgi:2-keto-3-deoxy-L-rhamnonate aldolase RhmA
MTTKGDKFLQKLKRQEVAFGTVISSLDPAVTELLAEDLDFLWIDMEHSPQTLVTLQGHLMAAKGTGATTLVRVAWNDAVPIKQVLDCGAGGVIVPMVRTADEARLAVSACLYPPEGVRGFGPRRPSHYGRLSGPSFCRQANEQVICILQIEHIDAVNNIDSILETPGVTALVMGPNDLAGSMNLMGDSGNPAVQRAIEIVMEKGNRAGVPVGIGVGPHAEGVREWIDKGMRWVAIGSDTSLLLGALQGVLESLRAADRAATSNPPQSRGGSGPAGRVPDSHRQ